MLPAAHRLRRRQDFTTTVRGGRRTGRPCLVVHLAVPGSPNGNEPVRAGFVVSKAVGPAVVRNRVKRRLRHLVAARLDVLPPASRIVVRALPEAASASSERLGADLDSALRRLRTSARSGRSREHASGPRPADATGKRSAPSAPPSVPGSGR